MRNPGLNVANRITPIKFTYTTRLQLTKENTYEKISCSMLTEVACLVFFALLSSTQAGENEIRLSIQGGFPKIGKLEHIIKTPYAGLYEVIINGQLLYTDEQGQYLFNGSVIEVKNP